MNRWRFEYLKLWELDASQTIATGGPGALALVPLMKGGEDLAVIEEAGRRIEALATEREQADLFSILHLLAGRRYTAEVLGRLVGRRRMIDFQSSLVDEFEARGAARGRLAAERELCVDLVRKYHPGAADRALPAIEACNDPARLKAWILSVADLDDDGFITLLQK